jgi:hypothetical protein
MPAWLPGREHIDEPVDLVVVFAELTEDHGGR